jgi:hypothetical protein
VGLSAITQYTYVPSRVGHEWNGLLGIEPVHPDALAVVQLPDVTAHVGQ